MISQLEKFANRLLSFFDSLGRARAAAELARNGYHEAANNLINGEKLSG